MDFNWKTEYYRYHHYFFNLQKIMQTSQARSLAWLSLSIFTVCFFAILAIRPTLITIAKLNKEIKDQKEASAMLQNKINAIVAAQQELAVNADNLPLLEEALPARNEFPKLAYFLEQAVIPGGLNIRSLNFEKVGEIKKTISGDKTTKILTTSNQLSFSLGITGDYFQLRDFLTSLESSRRIIQLETASFNQARKDNTFEILLTVSGKAFYSGN